MLFEAGQNSVEPKIQQCITIAICGIVFSIFAAHPSGVTKGPLRPLGQKTQCHSETPLQWLLVQYT